MCCPHSEKIWEVVETTHRQPDCEDPSEVVADWFTDYASTVLSIAFGCYFVGGRVPILKLDNCAIYSESAAGSIELALLGPGFAGVPSDRHVKHTTARRVAGRTGLRSFLITQTYNLHLKKVINRLAKNRAVDRQQLQRQLVRSFQNICCEVGMLSKWSPVDVAKETAQFTRLLSRQRELRHATDLLSMPTSNGTEELALLPTA